MEVRKYQTLLGWGLGFYDLVSTGSKKAMAFTKIKKLSGLIGGNLLKILPAKNEGRNQEEIKEGDVYAHPLTWKQF